MRLPPLRRFPRHAIMIASEVFMAQLIVRNLDDAVKRKLQRRAARYGRSMEEVGEILRGAVNDEGKPENGMGTQIAERFRDIGPKEPIQELRIKPRIPKFDDDHYL